MLMKYFYTLMLMLVLGGVGYLQAQEQTLTYADTPVLHLNPFGWGYIAGTNSYNDTGKYQRFDFTGSGTLVSATFWMGARIINNTPDTVVVVVRTVGEFGHPDELLAEVVMTLDQFAAPGDATRITFQNPIPFNTDQQLFIGLEWGLTADDRFAIFADANGEGEGADRAWERFDDGTLQRFNENSNFSWRLDADLHIAAGYLTASSVGEVIHPTVRSLSIAPNPCWGTTQVLLTLDNPSQVSLEVFDLAGRRVHSLLKGNLQAGTHQLQLPVKDLPSGSYFICLQTGFCRETHLFMVR